MAKCPAIFKRETTFVTYFLILRTPILSENEYTLEKMTLLPKFFPLELAPFQNGKHNNLDKVASPEHVYIPLHAIVDNNFN